MYQIVDGGEWEIITKADDNETYSDLCPWACDVNMFRGGFSGVLVIIGRF